MSDIFITNQNKNTILNRKGSIEAQKNVINHAVASKFNMSDKKAEDLWKKNLTAPEVSEAADNWNVFDCDNEVEALANVPSADRDTKALKKAIMNRRTTSWITLKSMCLRWVANGLHQGLKPLRAK